VFQQTTDHTEYFEFEALREYPQVAHGVFTRRRGFSSSPYAGLNGAVATGDNARVVLRNRRAVAEAVGLPLIWARPVHRTDVVFVDRAFAEGAPGDAASTKRLHERLRVIAADAMVTDVPGLALCWARRGWRHYPSRDCRDAGAL
jgi:copper oxidase (laccase) domain-containing protein